jgi:hypothetical protein
MQTVIIKLSFITLFFLGCAKTNIESNTDLVVRGGFSFGECRGVCQATVEVIGSKINFKSYQFASSKDILKQCDGSVQTEELNKALTGFQFTQFKALQKTYGCPDCNDGGAEWIEIQKGNEVYKTTFEFGKPPVEVKLVSEFMHTQYAVYKDCR